MNAVQEKTQKSENKKKSGPVRDLEIFLASDYALYVKTQNFHWNVTGPLFRSLHKLFEEQYLELLKEVDEVAERIRSLGFFVQASLDNFSELSTVEAPSEEQIDATQMIQELVQDHRNIIEQGKKLVDAFEAADDAATSDFVVGIVERHEKTIWMLNSSL